MRQWFFDFTQEAVSPGEKRPEAGQRQAFIQNHEAVALP
jgi:hypothetical protein